MPGYGLRKGSTQCYHRENLKYLPGRIISMTKEGALLSGDIISNITNLEERLDEATPPVKGEREIRIKRLENGNILIIVSLGVWNVSSLLLDRRGSVISFSVGTIPTQEIIRRGQTRVKSYQEVILDRRQVWDYGDDRYVITNDNNIQIIDGKFNNPLAEDMPWIFNTNNLPDSHQVDLQATGRAYMIMVLNWLADPQSFETGSLAPKIVMKDGTIV